MATGVLEHAVLAFSTQIAELQTATLLRVDDATGDLYRDDLVALESRLREVEGRVREIRAHLARDRAAIPAARAVIQAATLQHQQLERVESLLPDFLPGKPSPRLEARGRQQAPAPQGEALRRGRPADQENHASNSAPAPRFITLSELESLSSYMRGRLTVERVNASLEELATYAAQNAALVAAARKGRVAAADKKHAMWLAYSVAVMEQVRGRRWVLELDLKNGSALRLDKSGKAILTVLRHLGRVSEARLAIEGTTHLALVLQD